MNQFTTGFLCEYTQSGLTCADNASLEIVRHDDVEREVYETYRCHRHTPSMEQLDARGWHVNVLPVQELQALVVA